MRSTAIPAVRGAPELTEPQLATLRAMLRQQRHFRLEQLNGLPRASTRARPLTDADREVEASLQAGARAALGDVLAALRRMDEGSFGRCRQCATQLPVERLEILPQVALCMPCQRAAESSPDVSPKAWSQLGRGSGPRQQETASAHSMAAVGGHAALTITVTHILTAAVGSADVTDGTDSADRTSSGGAAARAAAEVLAERSGVQRHDVALVLGSGWVPAVDALGTPTADIPVTELPGFLPPAVTGHAGRVRSLEVADTRVLAFLGRTHLYEGHGVAAVVHGVRVAAAAGCRTVVLTNASGGLRAGMQVGDPVLISDHLNLTGRSPLVGPRFVDLTDLYSSRLRGLLRSIDPSITEGVYAALPGPHYETPAEIRMIGTLGADLVGMSTALEAIAARAEGCEVLGLSLVTNLAAGLSGEPLDHGEVLEAGRAAASRMGPLLGQFIELL